MLARYMRLKEARKAPVLGYVTNKLKGALSSLIRSAVLEASSLTKRPSVQPQNS
jgi:hypothetical protein